MTPDFFSIIAKKDIVRLFLNWQHEKNKIVILLIYLPYFYSLVIKTIIQSLHITHKG